jgi:hypothetical protein
MMPKGNPEVVVKSLREFWEPLLFENGMDFKDRFAVLAAARKVWDEDVSILEEHLGAKK